MRSLLSALFSALLLALAGCNLHNSLPKLNDKIDSLGTQLKQTDQKIVQTKDQITGVDQTIKATQTDVIDTFKRNQQQASEFVFGATQATNANTQPNLYTRHAQTELLRATAILGTPTQQNILDANRRLELRVSEKETALADLQGAYEQKDRDIAGLQTELTTKERAITTLTRERETLDAEKNQLQHTRNSLSDEVSDKKSKLIAKEQEERRRAEDTKALKKQLMVYLGIAGIVCGLGAAAAFRF